MKKYTPNEWRRWKTTLQTSGEDHFQSPDELFETISQCLLAGVDRDCMSGWGGIVTVMYIFSTRFEFVFSSSPLVSSVLLHLLHSFRVCFCIFSTRFESVFQYTNRDHYPNAEGSNGLKLHSFRVEKIKTTLVSSGEDCIVCKFGVFTFSCFLFVLTISLVVPSEWVVLRHRKIIRKTTLETSGEDWKTHSKRVEKIGKHTPNEWRRCKNYTPNEWEKAKLHSKRVRKMQCYTPIEKSQEYRVYLDHLFLNTTPHPRTRS